MAGCRFCGARLEGMEGAFDCPLCGCHNAPDRAPVRLEWAGDSLACAMGTLHLPFGSAVAVAPGRTALLDMDGRVEALGPGEHRVYPQGGDAARVTFLRTAWRPLSRSLSRTLPLRDAAWELGVDCACEVRVGDPRALEASDPFDASLEERLSGWLREALDAALDAALAPLAEAPCAGRDALTVAVDAALARIDAEGIRRRLEGAGHGCLEVRGATLRRMLLAREVPDGEPCPACGRRNPRAEGVHTECAFCGRTLFWCANCRRHVLRRNDRWCPECRGRIYA